MRIALMTDSFVEGQGGVSTAVAALARSLRKRNHEVVVYTAADPSHEQSDLNVVGLRSLHYERFPGGRVPIAPISVVQELANFKPDMIHNHSMSTMGVQALAAARLLGIPILGTCHVFLAGFLQYAPLNLDRIPLAEELAWRYTTTFFNRFPIITVPSETMKRMLVAHGLHVQVEVVSNGVDTDIYSPKPDGFENDAHSLTLLHVGRLGYEKRVDIVLQAFASLKGNHPQIRLLIVGDGPEAEKLKKLAASLGIAEQVQFVGMVSHDHLPDVYRQADLFITASTIETQGLVVLEAMACGLPVVGVDALALPDLIQSGVNGYLAPPEDDWALADATDQLLRSIEQRYTMGRASRRLALRHNLSLVSETYDDLYQQVCSRFRAN